jgi:hypothetical protein
MLQQFRFINSAVWLATNPDVALAPPALIAERGR